MTCLDENSALDFLSGRLGPTALSQTERHLGTCAPCVELLARSAPFFPGRPVGEDGDSANQVTPPPGGSPSVPTVAMPGRRGLRLARTLESDIGSGEAAITGTPATTDESDLNESKITLLPGTVLKDTYTVLELIGRGGMGEVYEVTHARLAGRYALKLLPPAFAHEHISVTRFRREADILSALRHPNIVQVIDFDHTPAGQPFLVMEYLDGGDLAQLMANVGAMPLPRVLRIVEQIVSALSAVHRKGIVHRDLKPQNVLLVHDEDFASDRVKLVDFGLSKRSEAALRDLSGNISRDQTLLGTPRYMAPEQATGRIDEIDATTDQFALAAMVYEMLTGTSAFDGEHMAMLLYRIVSEEPLPMRRYVADLPDHVEAAVRRAMAKQRAERFSTATEFLDALLGRPTMTAAERSGDSARGVSPAALAPAAPVAPATPAARGSKRSLVAVGAGIGLAAALAVGWHAWQTSPPVATAGAPAVAAAPPRGPEHRPDEPAREAPPAPQDPVAAIAPPAGEGQAPDRPPAAAVVAGPAAAGPVPAPRRPPGAAGVRLRQKSAAGRSPKTGRHAAPAASVPAASEPSPPTAPEPPAQKVGRLVEEL